MHWLSARHRPEFLAVPQLPRFTLANGQNGPEATLLIKATTLTLKYLLRLKKFRLLFFQISKGWFAYAIQIDDDPEHPAILWSAIEYDDELNALKTLIENPRCIVFLFNELAINVAWGEAQVDLSGEPFPTWINSIVQHPTGHDAAQELGELVDAFHQEKLSPAAGRALDLPPIPVWHPLQSHYVTNRVSTSLISIFEGNEGRQQEEIAVWLIDNLHPTGAVRSPQVLRGTKSRELSDVLISYPNGAFLIESKTLAILARDSLPSRAKLSTDVVKHIEKAANQLVGAVKSLRKGHPITDVDGRELQVEREKPPHVILLVPDLSLLSSATELGGQFFREISVQSGGFFHILDPVELLRVVQAAGMISDRSKTITPMMAFDYYLMERSKRAVASKTPAFNVLLRFSEESTARDDTR